MDKVIRSICQNLASNEQLVRNRGIRRTREFLKKNRQVDELGLCKLCKGLYYCLWMTGDPIQVHKLSLDIIQFYKLFPDNPDDPQLNLSKEEPDPSSEPLELEGSQGSDSGLDGDAGDDQSSKTVKTKVFYFRCLLSTVAREWELLDKNRVDKMLLFTRIMVSEILVYLEQLQWDLHVSDQLSAVYLDAFGPSCLGLLLHFIQVYLTELVQNFAYSDSLQRAKNTHGKHEQGLNGPDGRAKGTRGKAPSPTNLTNGNVNEHENKAKRLDGTQLLYLLKPFLLIFLRTKDKLVLQTIYNYVFMKLHDLSEVADISMFLHLLNSLAVPKGDSASEENGLAGSEHSMLNGLNKKLVKNTLKLYEGLLKHDLSDKERLQVDQMLGSAFAQHQQPLQNGVGDHDLNSSHELEQGVPTGVEFELDSPQQGSFIGLADMRLRRMSLRRLRNLCILNNTKNFLIASKSVDPNSLDFLRRLRTPRVSAQLFYFSLTRLRRLKLQHRFKHNQLDRIYDFNKNLKTRFNINLKQALDNIRNIKPAKSSLANKNVSSGNKRGRKK